MATRPQSVVGIMDDNAALQCTSTGECRLTGQVKILEGIARGAPLDQTLSDLATVIENEVEDLLCGICLIDPETKLVTKVVAANLPVAYKQELLGADLSNPINGPCATAVCERRTIVSINTAADSRWAHGPWRKAALTYGFKHSRSTPIFDSKGEVVGTFAFYFRTDSRHHSMGALLSETAAHLASIAIEKEADEGALKESEARARARAQELETILDNIPVAVWVAHDPQCHDMAANRAAIKAMRISPGTPHSATPADGSYPYNFKWFRYGHEVAPKDLSMQTAGRTGQKFTDELELRFFDGSSTFLVGRAVPLFDEKQQIRGVIGAYVDLTDRKRAEAVLRETERNLRLAVQATGMGLWDLDLTTGEITDSEKYREILGLPSGITITYDLWISLIHPEDRARADHDFQRALNGDGNFSSEYRIIYPNGEIRWVSDFGIFLFETDEDQLRKARRAVGTILDITDRKYAEQIAAENAQRFRFLAESVPDKIFTATQRGEINYLNPQWTSYSGYSINEIISSGWDVLIHPDDLTEKTKRWKSAINTGTPFEFEHRFRRADGSYRWHLSRAHPMRNANGAISMWIGSSTDVDDLKRAQFRLQEIESRSRLAIEAAGIGFWDWHLGSPMKWSPEHNRILGLDPELTEGSYELFMERVHPDDRPRVEAAIKDAQRTRVSLDAEFRVIGSDQAIHWIAVHGRAHFDEETGKAIRMLGIVRDITERKHFEERLRKNQQELEAALAETEVARDEAEAAARAKDKFLAVLSHELRTPLTPVLMAVSSLGMNNDISNEVRDALQMIQRNIQIEARLIDDLLDLTRFTRNKIDLQTEKFDLHSAVHRALEICKADIEAKSLLLSIELGAHTHYVEGDLARFQQVFWNLIKNAVKFTSPGGSIGIRSFNEHNKLCVQISDSGIGISPEVMPRIFNPFEQGDETFIRQFGGLGLGLAISKAIVEAHHGHIYAHSEGLDCGAIFTVELEALRHAKHECCTLNK